MKNLVRIATVPEQGMMPILSQAPLADPGPGQVRIAMKAAALNFADLLMVEGTYQDTPPYPFIPGLEGAGEVVAAGPGATLSPGTRVAVVAQGTMTQFGNFDQQDCYPIPDQMSFAQAAGFLIAYGTSHLALGHRAQLMKDERLVVLGAAGGVGLTAVEIGAAMGAHVVAVARGADKLAIAQKAGAHELIDSAEIPDLKAALRAGGGVDVVYDPVGDLVGLAAFGALRRAGRFLVIGFAGGRPPKLPLNHALVKNIAIHGFYWGGYRHFDPAVLRTSITDLFTLFEDGKISPHVGATLPFCDMNQGYELLRNRTATGKVIITI